jgi:hypothetical protein
MLEPAGFVAGLPVGPVCLVLLVPHEAHPVSLRRVKRVDQPELWDECFFDQMGERDRLTNERTSDGMATDWDSADKAIWPRKLVYAPQWHAAFVDWLLPNRQLRLHPERQRQVAKLERKYWPHSLDAPPTTTKGRAMTDRELLELAAKAARIPLKPDFAERYDYYMADKLMWNPLTNDGDALRLAVTLSIDILHRYVGGQRVETLAPGGQLVLEPASEPSRRDIATRRAIVRAAAEIGRAMLPWHSTPESAGF